MATNVNFDELAGKAFAPEATSDDYEKLFAAAFSLDAWFFIADAEFQYKMPYCAPFKMFGDAIALTVFTDGERARKYIAEGGLKGGAAVENVAPEDLIMRISTAGILDFFDKLAPFEIVKIFFNPNKDSHGCHHDLKMMRPIYEHLENKALLTKTDDENSADNLTKLLEENADVIADFDREHAVFSPIIAGSAAGMEGESAEERESSITATTELFESVRLQQNMSPVLFRVYIETCLEKRKFLMPTLAFAYLQQDKTKWQKLEQDAEFIKDYADWMTRKLVPGAEMLMNEPEQKSDAPSENAPTDNDKTGADNSEVPTAPFDELSRKVNQPNPPMEDLNALFGAAFALENWLFIARGELPHVSPYVASNAEIANGAQMLRAFTDSVRLERFVRENNLLDADGNAQMLSVPTKNIVESLEQYVETGIHGIWFNSDSESDGFFVPLKQLRPIKEHLAKVNQKAAANFTALLTTISDGLMMPSGFVKKSTYNCNFFCWIPREWTEDLQLKTEYLEKLYEQFYGANWRAGNSDGSRYVVTESHSAVISPERVQGTDWNVIQNSEVNRYWFYVGEGGGGAFTKISADEFQTRLNAYFQEKERDEARKQQDNLASWGLRETPDGGIEPNLFIGDSPVYVRKFKETESNPVVTINQAGAVNFGTSITPFHEAIAPLLKDFQGTGDYISLLRFEDGGKSEQVENISENLHGAYLQIRKFLYLNPKNGVRIGVNSIHSNRLRHTQSNAELLVSIELCKNLDNRTAVFYHAFQGPKSDVLNLSAAIQPLLEASGYQAVQ